MRNNIRKYCKALTQPGLIDWPKDLADYFQSEINKAYPDALISDYQELIPILTNDEKDRHVLAAAIRGRVDLIITFNLKDFGEDDLAKWSIEAMHPQDYLLHLYSMNPTIVMLKLSQIANDKYEDIEKTILGLGKSLPKFSSKLMAEINQDPI